MMSEELLPHFDDGDDDQPVADESAEPSAGGEGRALDETPAADAGGDEPTVLEEAAAEPAETIIEESTAEPEDTPVDTPPPFAAAAGSVEETVLEEAAVEPAETIIEESTAEPEGAPTDTSPPAADASGDEETVLEVADELAETALEEPAMPEIEAPPALFFDLSEDEEAVEERIVFEEEEEEEDDGTRGWQEVDDSTRPHQRPEGEHPTPTSDIFATLADLPGMDAEPSTLVRERGGRRDGGFQRRTVVLLIFASLLMCVVILGGLYALYLLTGSVPEQVARFAAPTLAAATEDESGGRAARPTPSPTVTRTPGGDEDSSESDELTAVADADHPAVGVTTLPTNTATPPDTPTPLPTASPTPAPTDTAAPAPTNTAAPAQPTPVPTISAPTLVPSIVTDGDGILLGGVSMVYLPGGTFLMGDEATGPAHEVTLSPYYIDKYEVTNAQWAACVEAGACQPPASTRAYDGTQYFGVEEYNNYPAIFVSWYNADSYCHWRGARLPTEAEWEMAARWNANTGVGTLYPWGDEWDPTRLNYCSGGCLLGESSDASYDDGWPQTAPVGSFAGGVSPAGVFDMSGNVAEWVADRYSAGYYAVSPAENPTGPESGTLRVVRGGSWGIGSPALLSATLRSSFPPASQNAGLGFRCAVTASDVTQ